MFFCDASLTDCNSPCGPGFIIVIHRNIILLARALFSSVESIVKAEFADMIVALNHCRGMNLCPTAIYLDCITAMELLKNGNNDTYWQFL